MKTNMNINTQIEARLTSNGKCLPSSVDLEESVLGAILIDKTAILSVRSILDNPDVFYSDKHATVYESICQLSDNNDPIDIKTVVNQLRKNGKLEFVGGAFFVSELTFKIQSSANIEYHSRLILQYWVKRLLINVSQKNINSSFDDTIDVFEIVDKSLLELYKISEKVSSRLLTTTKALLLETLNDIGVYMTKKGITGISSGWSKLDLITGGWQKSDLIILAARPGMGKTTFALLAARNAAIFQQKKGLFVSLEMSNQQLMIKLISTVSGYSTSAIKKGNISNSDFKIINQKSNEIYTDNIILDDSPNATLSAICSKASLAKTKYGIEWMVIDYLQLLTNPAKKSNREQEISSISRGLKQLAKELDLPIICLSQLSRATETRGGNKRPQLSDLRESGAIEQDADMVVFLYRPAYYDQEDISIENNLEVIISKNRNGPVGLVELWCDLSKNMILDFAPSKENNIENNNEIFKKIEPSIIPNF